VFFVNSKCIQYVKAEKAAMFVKFGNELKYVRLCM